MKVRRLTKEEMDAWVETVREPVVHPPYDWQTMETAPKDGKYVDLWVTYCCFAKVRSQRFPDCYWQKNEKKWFYRSHSIDEKMIPTHWMRVGKPETENTNEQA